MKQTKITSLFQRHSFAGDFVSIFVPLISYLRLSSLVLMHHAIDLVIYSSLLCSAGVSFLLCFSEVISHYQKSVMTRTEHWSAATLAQLDQAPVRHLYYLTTTNCQPWSHWFLNEERNKGGVGGRNSLCTCKHCNSLIIAATIVQYLVALAVVQSLLRATGLKYNVPSAPSMLQ